MLANRLSADPACRVLLVEAGHDARHFWLRLPVGYFRSIYDPRFSWQFPLEPEAATGSRQVAWPRGKALGGSSVINGLLYIRGQPADFDDWAPSTARPAGATATCCRSSSDRKRYEGGASEWHGASGELGVSDLRNDHPYCEAWLAAGAEAGCPLTPTSTARSPTASAATSSRCAAAGAATRRRRSSRRCAPGRT